MVFAVTIPEVFAGPKAVTQSPLAIAPIVAGRVSVKVV
jgi:hypothetical protein